MAVGHAFEHDFVAVLFQKAGRVVACNDRPDRCQSDAGSSGFRRELLAPVVRLISGAVRNGPTEFLRRPRVTEQSGRNKGRSPHEEAFITKDRT